MADDSRYLPAGVKVDPYAGNEPSLDPDLAKIRDEEVKALEDVKVEPRPEPTIDPELVKARDEELARDKKRAKSLGLESRATSGEDHLADEAPAKNKKS